MVVDRPTNHIMITTIQMARLRSLIRDRTGLVVDRDARLEQAVAEVMAETGLLSAGDLADALSGSGSREAWHALVPRLTGNDGGTWRGALHLQALERHVLPDVVRSNAAARTLRVWAAGCATGEEAWTVAMMLLRRTDLDGWDLQVLGTERDVQALDRAEDGRYTAWSFREAPAAVRKAFFGPAPRGRLEVTQPLRRIVEFRNLDLAAPVFPSDLGQFDVILCRNDLLWMDRTTAGRAVQRFRDSLRPGGWLLAGRADTAPGPFSSFEVHARDGAMLHRRPPARRVAVA